MTIGLPNSRTYIELLQAFPPRPIASNEELLATQEVIDSLLDRSQLSEDERNYLNILGTLVYEYEERNVPIPDIHGVELIKALMVEQGLKQKDLVPVFKTNLLPLRFSWVSEI